MSFTQQQQQPGHGPSNDENEPESKSNQQQQQQQQQGSSTNLKKMKLSPTKDQEKSMLNPSSESQDPADNAMDVSPTAAAAASGNTTTDKQQPSSQIEPLAAVLPPASLLFSSKAKIEFRFSNANSQQVLTGSATTPTYINATLPCILNSFSSRLNESKSYETIKTLLDGQKDSEFRGTGRVQRSSENATDKCFKSFESESDEETGKGREREESVKNSSSSLLSSLVKILPSSTNKSSSSSSKTGSNKNSLHGSIETMIPVL